jgi:RNA polymerase sigma-70 factor (ECF subfamily)
MPSSALSATIDRLSRAEWGRLLSALIRDFGDFDLAEDALQGAFAAALEEWAGGVPRNPSGWIYRAARHDAIDQLRRRSRFASKRDQLEERAADDGPPGEAGPDEEGAVPDERLRLIFTCCHPALPMEAQVGLTLRTVCGLTTEEIARAFLVPTTTMAQRLVRAKAKIRAAGIPYSIPPASELPERLASVAAVVYLVFNEGYGAAQGEALVRGDLCAEAIHLARLIRALLPAPEPELDGLLALMLLHWARRAARTDAAGNLVLLPDQDRSRWDRDQINEGRALIAAALRAAAPGPYALEAAIAAVHSEAARHEDTDWRQVVGLYDRLYCQHRSPIVALNRAAAIAMADGPAAALPLVEALAAEIADYHLWHSARADLLRRLGRLAEAADSYRRAVALTQNEVERRFLEKRLAALTDHSPG